MRNIQLDTQAGINARKYSKRPFFHENLLMSLENALTEDNVILQASIVGNGADVWNPLADSRKYWTMANELAANVTGLPGWPPFSG
jgi:hypothetical protein